MSDLKINAITNVDLYTVQKVFASNKISDGEKVAFFRQYQSDITDIIKQTITSSEYAHMMQGRPLQKFRPLKNSFTKRGDKILLAKALGIDPSEIDFMIRTITEDIEEGKDLSKYSPELLEKVKTYVYRHGKKDQLVVFLDYKLNDVKDIVQYLYRTLEYNSGGVADYFVRPIHRMDNKTLINLYKTIDDKLDMAHKSGQIALEYKEKTAKWALVKLCEIQSNSKLINAIKTYNKLK
jgi:hypothetical protein